MLGTTFPSSAQTDPDERKNLYLGASVPMDSGNGDPSAAAYFHWNRLHWPRDDMQFRLIFAGLYLDTLFTWPHALDDKTSFNIGPSVLAMFDGLTEFRDGEDLDHQKFYGDTGRMRMYVEREMFKLWDQLPFNIKLEYELRGSQYRTSSSTDPSFVLPADSYTQMVELAFVLGGISPGIVHIEGAEAYVKFEADWRGNWQAWGPVGAPFQTSNNYQKITAGVGALLPVDMFIPSLKKHYFGLRFSGGHGIKLDRLSEFKLGGTLPTGRESSVLHGFYSREIFASDFLLTNFSYEVPLADWHELAAHVYADYAAVRRKDIADDGRKSFEGVGAGLSWKVWGADMLLSYGFGINAPRLGHEGGHEIAFQVIRRF